MMLFLLKYLMRFSLTSNFCMSRAVASMSPMSLSRQPTLNSSLLMLDHRILSRMAFAVRSFTIRLGSSFCWLGHCTTNSISLYAWMKNALPSSNSSQFYSYEYLLVSFSRLMLWVGSGAFFFLFWLWPRLLFFRCPSLSISSISSSYSFSESTTFFSWYFCLPSGSVFSSSFSYSEPFLFWQLILVEQMRPFWVRRQLCTHPQKMESMYSPSLSRGDLTFCGRATKLADEDPSWPFSFLPHPHSWSLFDFLSRFYSMLIINFCCMFCVVMPSTLCMYFFSMFFSLLPSSFSTLAILMQASKPISLSHCTTLSVSHSSSCSRFLSRATKKVYPLAILAMVLPLRGSNSLALTMEQVLSTFSSRSASNSQLRLEMKQACLLPTVASMIYSQGTSTTTSLLLIMFFATKYKHFVSYPYFTISYFLLNTQQKIVARSVGFSGWKMEQAQELQIVSTGILAVQPTTSSLVTMKSSALLVPITLTSPLSLIIRHCSLLHLISFTPVLTSKSGNYTLIFSFSFLRSLHCS